MTDRPNHEPATPGDKGSTLLEKAALMILRFIALPFLLLVLALWGVALLIAAAVRYLAPLASKPGGPAEAAPLDASKPFAILGSNSARLLPGHRLHDRKSR